MSKDFPLNQEGMIGYGTGAVPTTDACDTTGADTQEITGNPLSMESPLQVVSLATESMDAPDTGAFQSTNLHDVNYLDPMKPHVSTESQG